MSKVTLQARKKPGGKVDSETLTIIEQLTLLKLDYAREFLTGHGRPHSGERETVRLRLTELLEAQPGLKPELRALLDELDAWGNQRVRLRHLSAELLAGFDTRAGVRRKAAAVGMAGLLDRDVDLVPPEKLTPMSISYEERDGGKFLRLVAARTRVLLTPEPDTKEVTYKEYPGIVFRPFRKETHKAVNFAEIDLGTGRTIISSPLLRPGFAFTSDFEEFYASFAPLISLRRAEQVTLYGATDKIRHALKRSEVRIRARRARTNVGGTVTISSQGPEADVRSDAQLLKAESAMRGARHPFCNCYWEAAGGLPDAVHTHILANEGEVVIMGQVREKSARYVLQRIDALNRKESV